MPKFLVPIDLTKQELQNARMHNLATGRDGNKLVVEGAAVLLPVSLFRYQPYSPSRAHPLLRLAP
jgi:hypothetical protein